MPDTILEDSVKRGAAVRLTQQVKSGGCASKLAPGTLSQVLASLPRQQDPNVMVGFDTSDDAGVYRISEREALVQTVDFFTPMVDDPFTYGRIAATNALSDVYAMGGRALTALALVCFPPDGEMSVLEEVMKGGLSVMQDAGCVVVGGHSVRDAEIKFGYAVTGMVDPAHVLTNAGAKAGDRLIFTKTLGTGLITTALKQGKGRESWVDAAIQSMTLLNKWACEVVVNSRYGVHAMTDVTGFGMMGHLRELALASGVRVEIDVRAVHLMDGAVDAVEMGCVPGGLIANRQFAECFVEDAPGLKISDARRMCLYDPQTAGGLLIAVRDEDAARLVAELREAGYPAASVIGAVVDGTPKIVLR